MVTFNEKSTHLRSDNYKGLMCLVCMLNLCIYGKLSVQFAIMILKIYDSDIHIYSYTEVFQF